MTLTRNYARALLFVATKQQKQKGNASESETEALISELINRFERDYSTEEHSDSFSDLLLPFPMRVAKSSVKYDSNFIRGLFLAGLIDIDSNIIPQSLKRILNKTQYLKDNNIIDASFQSIINNAISIVETQTNEYKVFMNKTMNQDLNKTWFNNCEKFIPPLLKAYNDKRTGRGFICDFSDIEQIIIDYSVVMSYQHFIQVGFLTEKISKSITTILAKMVDYTIVTLFFGRPHISQLPDYNRIENAVLQDLSSPLSIKMAYEGIAKL